MAFSSGSLFQPTQSTTSNTGNSLNLTESSVNSSITSCSKSCYVLQCNNFAFNVEDTNNNFFPFINMVLVDFRKYNQNCVVSFLDC